MRPGNGRPPAPVRQRTVPSAEPGRVWLSASAVSLRPEPQARTARIERHGQRAALQRPRPDFYFTIRIALAPLLRKHILTDRTAARLVWMSRTVGIMCARSLPAINGTASIAHQLKCARFSAAVSLPLPTASMSGPFQCPDAACAASPACMLAIA
jgi:hypothetical protein